MSDAIDRAIRAHLQDRRGVVGRAGGYPDADTYYRFVMDELQGAELQQMLDFLKDSDEERHFVLSLRKMEGSALRADKVSVPAAWIEDAKRRQGNTPGAVCPHCGKSIRVGGPTPLRRYLWSVLWLALAAGSFGASFIFKRFFMQWLALSLFFGFKWVMDLRQAKTQILIYKALKPSAEEDKHSRLHQHERPL